jgi:hypothetical protein
MVHGLIGRAQQTLDIVRVGAHPRCHTDTDCQRNKFGSLAYFLIQLVINRVFIRYLIMTVINPAITNSSPPYLHKNSRLGISLQAHLKHRRIM